MSNWRDYPRALLAAFALFLIFGLLSSHSPTESAQAVQADTPEVTISPIPASPAGARYRVEASQSRFIVHAFVGGLLSFAGHNHTIAIRDLTGEVGFTYGTVEPASLQLTIKADSLAVTDKVSESDRQKIQGTMRDEVLETAKYPEIVFNSTNVTATKIDEGKYQARISGDLTLHGVTRNVTINAQLEFGENNLRALGDFPLRQANYNIKPVSVAGGTIKVKDELKFSFDIVANQ